MSCAKKGFGIVGLGVWGETHLRAYTSNPLAELRGICDQNEARLKDRKAQFGVDFATTDYRELLAREDINAVSVVTPDFLHREIAVAACEAGKHVLLEKPMATSVAEAQAIADAAKANGVMVMTDFHNRWNPAICQVKAAIDQGELGEPQMISLRLNDTIYVPTGMLSWGGTSTVVWFLGSHTVDVVRWLFNDEIVRVYSVSRSRVLAARGVNTPDFFHTICELKGGGVAHIENCWIMSDALPTVCDFRGEVIGSEGTCLLDCIAHRMVEKYSSQPVLPISSTPGAVYPDVSVAMEIHGQPRGFGFESIWHFVDCVAGLRKPLVTPEDGVRNTAVLVAIHKSAELGQPVEVEV
ncbi:MAG: Gfo/Idh/MocA family oxidoreductase [Armatimonadia bacterium]